MIMLATTKFWVHNATETALIMLALHLSKFLAPRFPAVSEYSGKDFQGI